MSLGTGATVHQSQQQQGCNMSELAKGNCVIAGNIETTEDGDSKKHSMAILVVFDSAESLRESICTGKCEFTIFGEPA